jgi:6-phosphogluconolactonase
LAEQQIEILDDSEALATRTAQALAFAVRESLERSGQCSLALSGGRGPAAAFRKLASERVNFGAVDLFQVDERVVRRGHQHRNLTLIEAELLANIGGNKPRLFEMPVDEHPDPEPYELQLKAVCGDPPVVDVVHLGLGPDGHVASLVPSDPVLYVRDHAVAMAGYYEGYRRMTLTYPTLDRAALCIFMVGGEEKAGALRKLARRDPEIPAGRLLAKQVLILADREAAALL